MFTKNVKIWVQCFFICDNLLISCHIWRNIELKFLNFFWTKIIIKRSSLFISWKPWIIIHGLVQVYLGIVVDSPLWVPWLWTLIYAFWYEHNRLVLNQHVLCHIWDYINRSLFNYFVIYIKLNYYSIHLAYSNTKQLHWENYVFISFQIEWDVIVVTVFLSILKGKSGVLKGFPNKIPRQNPPEKK